MQPRCQLLPGRLSTPRSIAASHLSQRTYATTVPTPAVKNPLQRRKGGDLGSHLPKHIIPKDAYIPEYPYGEHSLFKQANRGLYGEQMIQFGNNVSHKTKTKTRRYWKPNILRKSLYSVALKKRIKLRLTSKVLKTMDREGGLDAYLLKDNEHRLKELGPLGWALRWTLMQRPEVIDQMRSQAAKLGIDQATIDAQWPTPQMLAAQKVRQQGLVKAEDLIPEEYEGTAEEDAAELAAEEGPTMAPGTYTQSEKRVARAARIEYVRADKAAQRYLSRNLVDSEEEGLKFAFIRAKQRQEYTKTNKQRFAKKLDQQFSAEDLHATRVKHNLSPEVPDDAVKRIAYNQWRRGQVELAGSYQAWRDKIAAANAKAQEHAAEVEEAGGEAEWHAAKRARYADTITEAETASTNEALEPARRKYLMVAMDKADRAIKAKNTGDKDAYAELTVQDLRASQASDVLGGLEQGAKERGKAEGDAWAALVTATNKSAPVESRLNA